MDLEMEQKLLHQCKTDLKNFSPIYDAYVKDIYRYAYSRLHNKNEAEDITSETFLKALEKLDKFNMDYGKSIKWWLFAIARNLIIDKYRKKEMVEFNEEYTAFSDEHLLDQVISKDMLKKVEDYIKTFNPPAPEIVELRVWEELSFEEIAEIMKKSVAAIKMAFYRALEKIQNEFMKGEINVKG